MKVPQALAESPLREMYKALVDAENSARLWTIFPAGCSLIPFTALPNFFYTEFDWQIFVIYAAALVFGFWMNARIALKQFRRWKHFRAARVNMEKFASAKTAIAIEHYHDQVGAAIDAAAKL